MVFTGRIYPNNIGFYGWYLSDFFLLFNKYFDTLKLKYKMLKLEAQIFDKKITFSEINFKKNLLFAN